MRDPLALDIHNIRIIQSSLDSFLATTQTSFIHISSSLNNQTCGNAQVQGATSKPFEQDNRLEEKTEANMGSSAATTITSSSSAIGVQDFANILASTSFQPLSSPSPPTITPSLNPEELYGSNSSHSSSPPSQSSPKTSEVITSNPATTSPPQLTPSPTYPLPRPQPPNRHPSRPAQEPIPSL